MADDFSRGEEFTNSTSNYEEESAEKPMPKQLTNLVGGIIVSGASKAVGVVEAGASYVSPPNVWPDMDNIDNLVNVLTVSGYAFTAFSIIGSTYFLTRTAREVFRWRSWTKYRRGITITRQKMADRIDRKKAEI